MHLVRVGVVCASVNRKNDPVQIDIPGDGYQPWRVPLQIRYEGRNFGSITFEVAINATPTDRHELVEPDGIALAAFAIDPPGWIPCLDVPTQIAQKLHACTHPDAPPTIDDAITYLTDLITRIDNTTSGPETDTIKPSWLRDPRQGQLIVVTVRTLRRGHRWECGRDPRSACVLFVRNSSIVTEQRDRRGHR